MFNYNLITACVRFSSLINTAARNGGVYVSAGGGTANVASGIIARRCNVKFEEAHRCLEVVGLDWAEVEAQNPWPFLEGINYDPRWGVETIAKAACT